MTALLSKRMFGLVGFTIAISVGGAIGAQAEPQIGVAAAVSPLVEQIGAPTGLVVNTGDRIFMNEAIKTGSNGAATVAFTDEARLIIDADSRTLLSSFIFADGRRYASATFHLSKGVFQFTPGRSDTHAYIFKTPTAVMTVRDASFDVAVTDDRTTVRVVSGAVELCRRGASAALILKNGSADDVRERNVIAFAKAPPFIAKEDICHRGPQCSLIGPGESGVMTGDDISGCVPPPPLPPVATICYSCGITTPASPH